MGVAGGWGIPEVYEYRLHRSELTRVVSLVLMLGEQLNL